MKGKTVTTLLFGEDLEGIKYAFTRNSTCKMYVIPRDKFQRDKTQPKEDFKNKIEKNLTCPALYILLGEEDNLQPKGYIGETENFIERIKNHLQKKDFWQEALVFISDSGDLTKSDVKYLEHKAIQEANKANTYILNENKQDSNAPQLPDYQKYPMDDFFDEVKFLASFIGCTIFEVSKQKREDPVFYITNGEDKAMGYYNRREKKFTLLKGSIIKENTTGSFPWPEEREVMINQYAPKNKENKRELKSDISFNSPSKAAGFVLGSNVSGNREWMDEHGKTLGDYRSESK